MFSPAGAVVFCREAECGIFILVNQVSAEKFLAAYNALPPPISAGAAEDRRRLKRLVLGWLRRDILAERKQGLTLALIAKRVAVASEGLLGIREVRALVAADEGREHQVGRPKKREQQKGKRHTRKKEPTSSKPSEPVSKPTARAEQGCDAATRGEKNSDRDQSDWFEKFGV